MTPVSLSIKFEHQTQTLQLTTEDLRRCKNKSSKNSLSVKAFLETIQLISEFNLDPLTLTLFLHDCLGRRSSFSDAIYRFKVELDGDLVIVEHFCT